MGDQNWAPEQWMIIYESSFRPNNESLFMEKSFLENLRQMQTPDFR
jgi:hypothetical protein